MDLHLAVLASRFLFLERVRELQFEFEDLVLLRADQVVLEHLLIGAGQWDVGVELRVLALVDRLAVDLEEHVGLHEVAFLDRFVHVLQGSFLIRELAESGLDIVVRDFRIGGLDLDALHALDHEHRLDVQMDLELEGAIGGGGGGGGGGTGKSRHLGDRPGPGQA